MNSFSSVYVVRSNLTVYAFKRKSYNLPIGGIIAVIGVSAVFNYTDTVLIIFGVISILAIFLIIFLQITSDEIQHTAKFFTGILFGITLFNSLTTAYWIVITWIDDFVKTCGDFVMFLVYLFIIPIAFLVVMILVFLSIAPPFLMFAVLLTDKVNSIFMVYVLPIFIAVIANPIYLFFILKCFVPMLQ